MESPHEQPEPGHASRLETLAAAAMGYSHEVSNIASGLEAIRFHLEEETSQLTAPGQVAVQQLGLCVDRLFAWQELIQDYQSFDPVTRHRGTLREVLTGLGFATFPAAVEGRLAERWVLFEPRWIAETRGLFEKIPSSAVSASCNETHAVLRLEGRVPPPANPADKMQRAVIRAYWRWMGGALLPETEGWQLELALTDPQE